MRCRPAGERSNHPRNVPLAQAKIVSHNACAPPLESMPQVRAAAFITSREFGNAQVLQGDPWVHRHVRWCLVGRHTADSNLCPAIPDSGRRGCNVPGYGKREAICAGMPMEGSGRFAAGAFTPPVQFSKDRNDWCDAATEHSMMSSNPRPALRTIQTAPPPSATAPATKSESTISPHRRAQRRSGASRCSRRPPATCGASMNGIRRAR